MTEANVNLQTTITNSTDAKKFQGYVREAVDCLLRIDAERDKLKAVKDKVKEVFEIKPALFAKVAKTYKDRNYSEIEQTNELFEYLYEVVADPTKLEADLNVSANINV